MTVVSLCALVDDVYANPTPNTFFFFFCFLGSTERYGVFSGRFKQQTWKGSPFLWHCQG